MSISAADVMTLRNKTNLPMMECKAALTEAAGNMDKAIQILREKNAKVQVAKGDREAAEGRVAIYIDPAGKVGSILEMRCESAPVAKSEHFMQLAKEIAEQVAKNNPASVEALLAQPSLSDPKKTVNDRVGEVIGMIRENMKPHRFARLEGVLGGYCHHDGSVGVLVQATGAGDAAGVLKDVAMHVTAKIPVAARREDVDPAVIAKETEIAKNQAAAMGKPPQIAEKIAEGKMKTWFAENVLVEQPFVKDETKSVGDLVKGAGLTMGKFVRYKVGELS